MSNLLGTNIIKTQLQTADLEIPSISAAVQDSGVTDIAIKGDQGDANPEEAKDASLIEAHMQTRKEEIPTNVATVKDGGTVQVTMGENKHGVGNKAAVQDGNGNESTGEATLSDGDPLQESGTVEVSPEEGKQSDGNPEEKENDSCTDTKINKGKKKKHTNVAPFQQSEAHDGNQTKVQHGNCKFKKHDKSIQTELSTTIFTTDVVLYGTVDDTRL